MAVLNKIRQFLLKKKRPGSDVESHFYPLSPTCQIPNLAIIYELYFGRRTDGCFVEVGAFDGDYVSNTSGLADIGWSGFYIEPVPKYFERCVKRHESNTAVTVSRYAVGAQAGKVEINVGGPLSTISDDMRLNFDSLDWAKGSFEQGKIQAEQITLEGYLVRHKIKETFELLVVDVEGTEWDMFRNFNIKKWRPQMVIIELHDQNNDYSFLWEECNSLVRYFNANGYKVVFKDFSNTVFVLKDLYPTPLETRKVAHEQ